MLGDTDIFSALAVKDLAIARKFYEETLGLKVMKELPSGGGVAYSSGKSGVLVYPSQFAGTNQATAAGWMVADVKSTVDALKAKGVTFEQYDDLPGATRDGDIHTFGTDQAAWFKDPDGNILSISTMG